MKLLYIFLIIASPSVVFAQSNYHEGYILKNNGDTLKGYINYREWPQSPRSVDFKINKDDKEALQFKPQTIKEFQITGLDTYIAYTGIISMDRTNFPDVPDGLDTAKKTDTIFLKQVVTGRFLTLFHHNDEIKTRFFIAETNDRPVELIYHEYTNDQKQVVNSPTYRGQLLLYINKYIPGNNKLISGIKLMEYRQSDLESIVDKINNNGNPVKKKSVSRFFAGIGLNNTVTEVNSVMYSRIPQNYTTISPKINAGIDMFDNPNVQRFVFRIEFSFSYVTPQYKYPLVAMGINTNQIYEFNQYTASITPQILFNVYNKDSFKVFIGGGWAFNLSAYSNNKFTIISADPNIVNAYTVQKPYTLESYWSNFPLEAGVTLNKKIELCFTYTGYAAYTKYTGFYASNQTTSLGLKYLFGK